ncbi:MAG TPA: hypothetical protein VKR41_05940 [Puia sp.]|nr:hypothetical protein [Puia sp.]
MHILLLIVYGTLASVAIWKMPFLQKSGIRPGWLCILFAGHVFTGWLHNWIAYRYFPDHGDIWNYFSLSFLYRHRLLSEVNLFLSDNSTWTYITHNGIVFIQMFLDLLSKDDMNINTLLFSFPVFVGNVALFRVFRRHFADDTLAATTVFWLPSVLFWTACIYREGMLYMLLGFLFYHLDRLFINSTSHPRPTRGTSRPRPTYSVRRHLIYSIVLFLLIAYFRLAVAIILLPAIFVWYWIDHPLPRPKSFILAAAIIVLIPTVSLPTLRNPLLRVITTEQASFQILEGHSRLPLPALDGTLGSVRHAFPAAIRNGFFEPLPGSGGQPIYLAFSIELLLIWLIVLLAAIHLTMTFPTRSNLHRQIEIPPDTASPASGPPRAPRPSLRPRSAFPTACLLFALAGMLTIGFFVPFAGTIVRYRSIYLPFLLAPTLHALRRLPIIQPLNRWLNNKLRFLI